MKAFNTPKDDLGFFSDLLLTTGFLSAALLSADDPFGFGLDFGLASSVNVKPQFLIDIIQKHLTQYSIKGWLDICGQG